MPTAPRDTSPPPAASKIAPRTLTIAGAASAIATYVVSQVWGPGTLIGAAATPVIVAIVSEGLRKPTEVVAQTVRVVPPPIPAARHRARAQPTDPPPSVTSGGVPLDPPTDVVRPPTDETLVVPGGDAPTIHTTARQPIQRRWKLAIVTGLVAFVIVALAYTARDVIAGNGLGDSGRSSTLFSGSGHKSTKHRKSTSTSTSTTSTPTATETVTTVTKTEPATTTPDEQTTTEEQTTTPSAPTGATGATGATGPSGAG